MAGRAAARGGAAARPSAPRRRRRGGAQLARAAPDAIAARLLRLQTADEDAPRTRETSSTVTGLTLAFGGKGVAKIDDFVVFVTGAVPGDVVRARDHQEQEALRRGAGRGAASSLPDRSRRRCPSFGTCGGCVWQDLDYGVQLKYKAGQVRESLEHLGGHQGLRLLAPSSAWPIPGATATGPTSPSGMTEEGAVVGFRPPGRWDSVLPLSECHLLDSTIEAVRATVEAWLRENELPGWDPRTGTGFARHLLVRSSPGGRGGPRQPGDRRRGTARRRRAGRAAARGPSPGGRAWCTPSTRARPRSAPGSLRRLLWGRPFLLERVAGVTLKVSIDAFFQTNTVMAARAVRAGRPGGGGRQAARRRGRDRRRAGAGRGGRRPVIWDLFSGVGSIGLSLAARGRGGAGHRGGAGRRRRCQGERPAQRHRQRPLRRGRRGQGAARGGRR